MAAKKTDSKDTAEAAPSGRPGWMLPVIVAVVALTAGAATALTPIGAALGGGGHAEEASHSDAPAEDEATGDGEEFGEFLAMESLVVNPRQTDGRHYLMVQIGAEAAKPETIERLKTLSPAANDAILTLLGQKTVPELSDIAARDSLKESIRTTLNGLLGHEGPVRRIYFIQYVIQ